MREVAEKTARAEARDVWLKGKASFEAKLDESVKRCLQQTEQKIIDKALGRVEV